MNGLTDQEAIRRVKNGEINNFIYIVRKYSKAIHSYVYKKLFKKEDVDDVVQNAFLNFYKAIDRFDEKRPVLPYLFQIVKNEIKMYFRVTKKTIRLDERIIKEETEDDIEKEDIEQLLKSLPEEQKKALELVGTGFSYREIAEKLNRPINTVRTIIRRARLRLMKRREYEKT